MGTDSDLKRFKGQAQLVRLLLWKVGETTDVTSALEAAMAQGMISTEDASFLLSCMSAEEASRDGSPLGIEVDEDSLGRLRRCADKLNRADSA